MKNRHVFIVCPVREITLEERARISDYVSRLEFEGCKVHWPIRDTDQTPTNLEAVFSQNRAAVENATEVHVYYNPNSQGSKFDIGMAYLARKPIKLINPEAVQRTPQKSFNNALLDIVENSRAHFIWEEHYSH